jgi:hypothetical protein
MNLLKDTNELLINILSKNVLLPGESKKELSKIKEKVTKDLKPVGALEEILCSKIISDTWKIKRLYTFETKILRDQQSKSNPSNKETYPGFGHMTSLSKGRKRFRSTVKQITYTKELEDIQRHISIVESGMLKTVSELTSVQKSRL